jgi:polyhydroxyalkanoate synthase
MLGLPDVELAPTPRDVVRVEGTSRLYRFRGTRRAGAPLLLVPSMINRWYVLDLRRGASLVERLVLDGIDTFCLDWGAPEAEDRYRTWDDALARIGRAVRTIQRTTRSERVSILGYCMGGTLAGIWSALHPHDVASLINLAGPFDFAHAGQLGTMTDPRWFDVDAVASAGNVSPTQMQSGFVALRPTLQIAKWIGVLDRMHDPAAMEAFAALETWASDNVAFPAAAYVTYIRELYQDNLLVQGRHHALGRRVDLHSIECPLLTIAAEGDSICPLPAARGLHDTAGSQDRELAIVPGGHVGAVIGSRARDVLYPKIGEFVRS